MSTIAKEVYCTFQVEGVHHWPDCPLEEVSYLRDLHRHMFHVKAWVSVNHDDRDVEFIVLKHLMEEYVFDKYYDETLHLCNFGSMSCEMIGEELIREFSLSKVEVSEDGENGATLNVVRTTEV